MPVNSTHPDYDAAAVEWSRARDVLAGEDEVKAGGERYLPRLDSQTDEEFAAYVKRAAFFNASARTSEAYLGLIFRRPPFVKLPGEGTGVGRALAEFRNDADMLGTSLTGYAKMVVGDVVGIGRAGSLIDWEGQAEQRAYVVFYRAEQIINWRVERVNGRNVPTLIVLSEKAESRTTGTSPANAESDPWTEVCGAMWGLGGWQWWWGTGASAQYDRIGVWNRVLTSDELEKLYGVGLGWTPGG
jgi:hypothetical protein